MSGSIGDNVFRASGVIAAAAAGRTGTVDWVTTVKVTGDSPITAVTGEGYFLNTTAGEITINLPAGVAGSIVSMADYARTWDSNKVTVAADGSEKIGGNTNDAELITEGQSVTFVYIDSTQGWVNIQDSTSAVQGVPPYITATGGTPCSGAIVCTNYKVHTFTGPGTFCVTSGGSAAPCSGTGSNTVDYLVVAGGGGGGNVPIFPNTDSGRGGAGGAGGYRESPGAASGCYTVSPLGAAPAVALPVTATPYTITVGGGAADGIQVQGSPSTFSSITSAGGGGGGIGQTPVPQKNGGAGGSGGGSATYAGAGSAGAGNTPPTNPAQGTAGGTGCETSPSYGSGGGGGATAAGGGGSGSAGGAGGAGATSSINATPTARAGGGGGATQVTNPTAGAGGAGGGGRGGSVGCAVDGLDAVSNTGGGGGGGGAPFNGGNGGSGVVIIRYKFQN